MQPDDDSMKLVLQSLQHSAGINSVTLAQLPAPVIRAASSFCAGEMAAARRVLQEFVRDAGAHAEALRLLGRIAHHDNQLDEAAALFEQVLRIAPGYRAARADYVRTLIEQQRYLEARQQLGRLLELEPGHRDYLFLAALIHAGLGQHELAIANYHRVRDGAAGWPALHLLLGNSLKAVGRQSQAIHSYRLAAAGGVALGDAWWSLANLKTYRFSDVEIGEMRSREADGATQLVDRYHLCFALGKALEDCGEYEESWRYYERGNALKAAHTTYDPAALESAVERSIQANPAQSFASQSGSLNLRHTPIFIVGLPRSGSTLVEQILASHSKVEGTQELPLVGRIAAAHCDPQQQGERYLAAARSYAPLDRPFFIDKMPGNFQHIGLIHRMLPTAKIIDVRRDPIACCVSNFRQLYARGNGFSYRVDHLARYYRSYLRLMNHWDEVLPGRVLRVRYEELVEDLAGNVLRLLRHCELDPEPGCLRFYATNRLVSTASSEQVRLPVYRTGLSHWRHFEPWLGALKEALARAPAC